MKKFISKLFITLTIICFIHIPSIHHIGFIAPYNDIPVSGENDH